MIQLNSEQSRLHARAMKISKLYLRMEWRLIEVLQEVGKAKLYKFLNCSSLFQYAVSELGLSEAVAYSFIAVARKAAELSVLQDALRDEKLSVSKASRIIAVLDPENAGDLIEFARGRTSREIDFEVARLNPKAKTKDSVKVVSEDEVEIKVRMSRQAFERLKRAEALEAQKGKKHSGVGEVLDAALIVYLDRHDPVIKAERALKPKMRQAKKLCLNRVLKRKPLAAREKHAVFARDRGQCTHVDQKGKRCANDRWVQIHHVHPVSLGGGNEPDNLTTLCSFHHDLVHQLSLPVEGQLSWLRSRQVEYLAGGN